jgi:hypothetical protein
MPGKDEMPSFDRFDICEAYLALEMDFNAGGIIPERKRNYSIGVQCDRIGFKVGAAWQGFESLSTNAREIYNAAAERLMLGDGGYKPCSCRDCFEIAIGHGRPMCHACVDAGCEGSGECQCEPEIDDDEIEGVES